MIKIILFDFDGTLADTKKIWMKSILKVLKQEEFYCPECEAKVIIHFGKKIKDMLGFLEITKSRALDIEKRIYKEFMKHKPKKVAEFSFLREIPAKKYILSNSPTRIIKLVLGGDAGYFDRIYGADKFTDKASFIKMIKRRNNLKDNEIAYVGDRAGDAVTASKARCVSIIISNEYSWNSREEIIMEEPDIILDKIENLKSLFKSSGHS